MRMTDQSLERMVSVLLKSGVLVSGGVVLAGGVLYMFRHGGELASYQDFHGAPSIDRIVPQIVHGAVQLRARSVIQVGVLLLIFTPVARVVLSMVGFAMEKDRTFVTISAIVLAVLLFSLIRGATAS